MPQARRVRKRQRRPVRDLGLVSLLPAAPTRRAPSAPGRRDRQLVRDQISPAPKSFSLHTPPVASTNASSRIACYPLAGEENCSCLYLCVAATIGCICRLPCYLNEGSQPKGQLPPGAANELGGFCGTIFSGEAVRTSEPASTMRNLRIS